MVSHPRAGRGLRTDALVFIGTATSLEEPALGFASALGLGPLLVV